MNPNVSFYGYKAIQENLFKVYLFFSSSKIIKYNNKYKKTLVFLPKRRFDAVALGGRGLVPDEGWPFLWAWETPGFPLACLEFVRGWNFFSFLKKLKGLLFFSSSFDRVFGDFSPRSMFYAWKGSNGAFQKNSAIEGDDHYSRWPVAYGNATSDPMADHGSHLRENKEKVFFLII